MAATNSPAGAVAAAHCDDTYFSPLFAELESVRNHGSAVKAIRASQVKGNSNVESKGQNRKARNQWIPSHALDPHGNYRGHAKCISSLAGISGRALSTIRRQYVESRGKPHEYPATMVLHNDDLL